MRNPREHLSSDTVPVIDPRDVVVVAGTEDARIAREAELKASGVVVSMGVFAVLAEADNLQGDLHTMQPEMLVDRVRELIITAYGVGYADGDVPDDSVILTIPERDPITNMIVEPNQPVQGEQ